MSLLPLTGASLSSLASGTAHPDSASKLLGAEADGVGVLRALVSVLEVVESDGARWSSKDRVKALVALSNLAQVSSLRERFCAPSGARRPASSASSRRKSRRAKNLEITRRALSTCSSLSCCSVSSITASARTIYLICYPEMLSSPSPL